MSVRVQADEILSHAYWVELELSGAICQYARLNDLTPHRAQPEDRKSDVCCRSSVVVSQD
jgi:hypothetical protein